MKNKIKERLLELSDKEYREFHKKLCPGTQNIIGVRTPVLREYAKELYNENNWKDIIDQIDDEYYEEIMLEGMIIGKAQKEDIKVIEKYIEKYVPKICNWAICDCFCAGLKITKKNKKEMWEFIQKYINSDKEFEIRFGIVMILDYYIESEYIEKDFSIFDKIENDGYYVKMAIAWAISVCIVKYYEETIKYLKRANLDDWTYNKAIQKALESYRIDDNKKDLLRKMKK